MKLYIKNMVCDRCKKIVTSELEILGIQYYSVELGEVNTKKKLSFDQRLQLYTVLKQSGLELISEENNILIEKLNKAIADLEHYSDEELKTNFSDYITLNVGADFISLDKLFAEIEGISIKKYIIRHKIEMIKELLTFNVLSLEEIATKMNYSSTAQLSRQFKNMTGLAPSNFIQLKDAVNFDPKIN